jgi:Co/Zn/Cd efflux system component
LAWGAYLLGRAAPTERFTYGFRSASILSALIIAGVHDLHIWAMSTTETALTVHLVCDGGRVGDSFLMDACHELEHRFGIRHSTIQIEAGELECRLAPTNVV